MRIILTLLLVSTLAACGTNLHKPTTTGNAGTTALVAYSVAGFAVGQYLALPLCQVPAVYPCKTQATNDSLAKADTAAHDAAVAADKAGNDPVAQANALNQLSALNAQLDSPYIKTQLQLKAGAK